MNEFETTLHLMMINNVSYNDLAEKMGHTNGGNLYNTLNRNKHIHVDTLRKILNTMGYDLVVRKQGNTEGGYVIDDDNTPSSLRFHDMSMEFGVDSKKKRLNLSRSERIRQTEDLKKKVHELTPFECEEKLREIWSTVNPVRKKNSTISEYEGEYLQYREEFRTIYGEELPVYTTPAEPQKKKVTSQTKRFPLVDSSTKNEKGKLITKDTTDMKDMSERAIFERQKESIKNRRDYLMSLTADFTMED